MNNKRIKYIIDEADMYSSKEGQSRAYIYLRNQLLTELKLIKRDCKGDAR
mgnify:CR=1 FL=1